MIQKIITFDDVIKEKKQKNIIQIDHKFLMIHRYY